MHFQAVFYLRQGSLEGIQLFLRHGLDVRIRVVEQLLVFVYLLQRAAVLPKQFDHITEIGMGLADLAVLLLIGIDRRIGKRFLKLHVLSFQAFQFSKHEHSPQRSAILHSLKHGAERQKKPAKNSWADTIQD